MQSITMAVVTLFDTWSSALRQRAKDTVPTVSKHSSSKGIGLTVACYEGEVLRNYRNRRNQKQLLGLIISPLTDACIHKRLTRLCNLLSFLELP